MNLPRKKGKTTVFSSNLSVQRIGRDCASGLLLVLTLFGLMACSSNDVKEDEELEPAELLEFQQEMNLDKLWSTSIGEGLGDFYNRIQPVFAGDDVIVASVDGRVLALDQEKGKRRWRTDLDDQISGGVGLGKEHVFVGTVSGDVVALQRVDGEVAWKVRLSSEVLAIPAALNNLLVVHTFDGKLYGLDVASGEQRWVHDGNMPVLTMRGSSSAVFFEDMAIIGTANGKIIALDRETGQLRWERRVAIAQGRSEIERIIDVDSTPLLSGGVVYAVSYQGRIVAFQAASGRPVWQETESSFNDMAEGYGNIYVSSTSSSLAAYNKRDGAIRWEQSELARRKISAPVTISRFVAVGDFEGYIHVMSQADGRMIARRRFDSNGIRSQMLSKDDKIFVYGNSGKLAVFRLASDS